MNSFFHHEEHEGHEAVFKVKADEMVFFVLFVSFVVQRFTT
jgi:hypothetical protein